jgi:hypothetical protein
MWRISHFSVLKERNDFGIPKEEFDAKQVQKPQVTSDLHEMIQQIYNLFNTKDSSAVWEKTLLHCEEILPQVHSLPERKEIQPLCLEGCQRRNHEIFLFFSKCAGKIKE